MSKNVLLLISSQVDSLNILDSRLAECHQTYNWSTRLEGNVNTPSQLW